MKTIKLTAEHRGTNSTTFTGRPQGKSVRGSLNLDQEDKDQEEVNIEIPKDTTSFNPSFYLGLFYDSILAIKGVDNFKEKYHIIYADNDQELVNLLKEDIEDCERQASNEYFRKINKTK